MLLLPGKKFYQFELVLNNKSQFIVIKEALVSSL